MIDCPGEGCLGGVPGRDISGEAGVAVEASECRVLEYVIHRA